MPKIKINSIGEGIEIRRLQLNQETYQHWSTLAQKQHQPLRDLLLDPFFYYGLKDKKIKSLNDVDAELVSGMLNAPKSHIEIWFNRFKVHKMKSSELFDTMLLFPLYQIEKNKSFISTALEKGIYVVQKTIGLLSSQQLEVTTIQLNIDDFKFTIAEFQNNQLVTDIEYQNQKLKFSKSETIITYQTSFEIE